jgi:Na+-driven multidrug efflux pump
VLFGVSYFFAEDILGLFDEQFKIYSTTFITLIFGVIGFLLFRGLFSDLLSSIGRANLNFYIALIGLTTNAFSNYYFIPKYGILGAAITSAIVMWLTSIITLFVFFYFFRKGKQVNQI